MNTLEVPVVTPDNMPRLGKIKAILHIGELALSVLILCTVAPVIATEIHFYEGSQAAPNWTLVVTIVTWWIPVVLFYFPWIYDRQNKFRRIGKFCLKPRTNLIFSIFGTVLWAAAAIAMTVHANNPSHCALDSERADSDEGYGSAWPGQCSCAKAAAAFSWINCLFWLATLVCSIIVSWNEKQLARQNRKQHEESKLEQGTITTSDEEAAAVLSIDLRQQGKCEVLPPGPCHQQQYHEPAVIPSNITAPFYQPVSMGPYSIPMPVVTGSPPLPAQTPYNYIPSYHPYQ